MTMNLHLVMSRETVSKRQEKLAKHIFCTHGVRSEYKLKDP